MRLHSDVPATGGALKSSPEDFVVEEIPAYEPSGTGEHLYLWVEKRNLTGDEMLRRLSRALDVPLSEIGAAGTKDRVAVTRQWVSARTPLSTVPDPGEGLSILSTSRHTNRLRTGHLIANRFRIRIRETALPPPEAAQAARLVMDRLSSLGLPNLFGPQRFGRDGETASLGMALITGEKVPSRVRRNRSLLRLALSAGQALLYNEYLSSRISDGLYRRVLSGDVLKKTDTGGLFNADPSSLATEQSRLDAGEIVHAGPIFGRKTFPARDEAAARERAVLDAHSITPENLRAHGKLLQGTRRPDIVYPRDSSVEETPDGFTLSFTLPSGSYATVLVSEVTGPGASTPGPGGI